MRSLRRTSFSSVLQVWGKTEIARRISKLAHTPFVKVEATKYTEVGYVGRDVESMVRDLMATSIQITKNSLAQEKKETVEQIVEERLLDLLLPPAPQNKKDESTSLVEAANDTRERFRQFLREGRFEDRVVEFNVNQKPAVGGVELLAGGKYGGS